MTDVSLTPLTNLPADSIGDLFSADPSTLDDTAFTSLIREVRRRRSEFASQEATKRAAPKAKTERALPVSAAQAAAADKPASELSLDDLEGM